jgi:hypothetical protein
MSQKYRWSALIGSGRAKKMSVEFEGLASNTTTPCACKHQHVYTIHHPTASPALVGLTVRGVGGQPILNLSLAAHRFSWPVRRPKFRREGSIW